MSLHQLDRPDAARDQLAHLLAMRDEPYVQDSRTTLTLIDEAEALINGAGKN